MKYFGEKLVRRNVLLLRIMGDLYEKFPKKRLKKVWREIKKAYLCNPQTKRGSPEGATVREEVSYLSCERAGAREKLRCQSGILEYPGADARKSRRDDPQLPSGNEETSGRRQTPQVPGRNRMKVH